MKFRYLTQGIAIILFVMPVYSNSPASLIKAQTLTANESAISPDIQSFRWITGLWKNSRSGSYEIWAFTTDKTLLEGRSYRFNPEGELFITERMRIFCDDGGCFYEADVPHNPAPVLFKITGSNDNSFYSENPDHDFPKFIEYIFPGDGKLEAKIGNAERSIPFLFEKVDE